MQPHREKVPLDVNVPVTLQLKIPTGKLIENDFGKSILYWTKCGRSLFVDLETSVRISKLGLEAGESFTITKLKRGKEPAYLDVCLSPATEKMRAAKDMEEPEPPSDLMERMEGTVANVVEGRPPAAPRPIRVQPAMAAQAQRGTGTYGPAPAQHPGPVKNWAHHLLDQTTTLIDVYAAACQHADGQGVPPAVVRTLLLSSFINVSKRGGCE